MEQGSLPTLPAYPIKERLEIDGINVLLLNVPPDQAYPQNLFGVTEKGDVLWQVEPRSPATPNSRYTSIRDEVGVIVARTEDKLQRKVDPKTGKVLAEEQAADYGSSLDGTPSRCGMLRKPKWGHGPSPDALGRSGLHRGTAGRFGMMGSPTCGDALFYLSKQE